MWTGEGVTLNESPQLYDGDLVKGPGWHLLSCICATASDGDVWIFNRTWVYKNALASAANGFLFFTLLSRGASHKAPNFKTKVTAS